LGFWRWDRMKKQKWERSFKRLWHIQDYNEVLDMEDNEINIFNIISENLKKIIICGCALGKHY